MAEIVYFVIQALFPFDDWWVVPAKVAFDQTFWSAVWNSIYFVVLGFLRLESPANIFGEWKATFWPMLTVRSSSFPTIVLHVLIAHDVCSCNIVFVCESSEALLFSHTCLTQKKHLTIHVLAFCVQMLVI